MRDKLFKARFKRTLEANMKYRGIIRILVFQMKSFIDKLLKGEEVSRARLLRFKEYLDKIRVNGGSVGLIRDN